MKSSSYYLTTRHKPDLKVSLLKFRLFWCCILHRFYALHCGIN